MDFVQAEIESNKDRYLEELLELLKIPSISADSKYAGDVARAAEFLEGKLVAAGLENVEICETEGHPIVYGEKISDENSPTVLVYGHYDVQPPDPLDLWHSPPFEPVIRDDKIYARGACDDKGQSYMHVKALEMLIKHDALPCNVKIMLEGEEEVGSDHLEQFVRDHAEKLSCDVVLISDTSIISNEIPSITTALRGLSYIEVEVTGPNRDLHSGVYGGAVANPINVLCEMIAGMMDETGYITIPGFYKDVATVSDADRAMLNEAPFDIEKYKSHLGINAVKGEDGYTTLERISIRPTLDVNGIWGGYMGEGAKTVLPSKAHAKISMRLVPNQEHEKITELFKAYFERIAPDYVNVKVTPHHGGQAVVVPTDSPAYRAASKAMETTFGRQPIPKREGGSIPIVAMFEEVLHAKSMLMGFGLDSDAIHSPNEHYGLFNFYRGIETIPYFYKFYAEYMAEEK
jgi:acetylornithine deacetylase/succinyl-diaminopimelate desuccinylase-like protein